jgi:hypothetical protein
MAQTETLKMEGTPEQLARLLEQLSREKRYRIVEVKEDEESTAQDTPLPDPKNAASIALLKSWIAQAPTDPEEIRAAEEELREFQRNMNQPRKEAGARLLYPEAE